MKNQLLTLTTIGLIFLFVILGCSAPAESNKGEKNSANTVSNSANANETIAEKPIKLNAKELTKAYEENELAADEKYKDKTLAVTGKVSNIAETFGSITVSLDGHNLVVSVMCSFDEAEKENVIKLKKGQQVTLIGKGDGMTGGLYAGLKECKIQ